MPIVIVGTPNSIRGITTLEALAEELGLTDTEANDQEDRLQRTIDQTTSFVEKYIGYPLAKNTYIQTFIGNNSYRLIADRIPVLSLLEVQYADVVQSDLVNQYFIEDADAGFIACKTPFPSAQFWRSWLTESPIRFGRYNVAVKYTAGYVMPDDNNPTLPADLELAALALMKAKYYQQGQSGDIRREDIGEASIWYFDRMRSTTNLSGGGTQIGAILDLYKVTES